MKRRLSLGLAAAAICTMALVLPLRGFQAIALQDGQSFYVVAVRAHVDTALFRVCQAGAQEARKPEFPGLELRPSREDRIVDATVKGRIEAEFRRQGRFRIAQAPGQADYVFFSEATYVRMTAPAPPSLFPRSGGNEPPSAAMAIVAIVVPAGEYAGSAGNAASLLKARLWQGANMGADSLGAWPEDVVLQLHDEAERRDANDLPPNRAARDRMQARKAREREQPRPIRLDGRSICAATQPQRAPEMSQERDRMVGEPAQPPAARPDKASDRPLPTFQTRVVAVAVPVVASNRQGAPVSGLSAADFVVFEDDVPQRIERVTAESEPFTAALVMDTSYSMLPRLAEVKAAASAFVEALRPEDRALAVTFDSRPWLVCDVTGDKDALRSAIAHLQPFGALTRVHDALDLVTGERLEKIAGRKALVVLTDGMDVGSQVASAGSVMARLEAANVPVYPVQFESGESRKISRSPEPARQDAATTPERYFDRIISFDHAREYLAQLARNTGGLLLPASTPDAIVQAFRRAADDVRSQYVLYYYPTNQAQDGTFRRIRVEVSRPGVSVRARAGYRAPGANAIRSPGSEAPSR